MAKRKTQSSATPVPPQELAPAAQALAAEADYHRQLAERALRRVSEILDQNSQVSGLTGHGKYRHRRNENPLPLSDGEPLTGAALDQWIRRSNDASDLQSVYRGIAYLFKQRELRDQGVPLSAWIQEQGLRRQRVYEEMGAAKMFAETSDGAAHLCACLNPQKQVLLASLPPLVIERMAVDGTLASMGEMTDRQAKEVIAHRKRLEKALDKAHETIGQLDTENRSLKARDGWKGELPPVVRQARVEGTTLALEALDCLTRLDALAVTLGRGVGLHADSDRRQAELRAGLGPLATQLSAIKAQVDSTLRALQHEFGDYIPASQALLSEGEARDARESFDLMINALTRGGRK